MFILDWLGAALTLVTLGFLLLGGYLLALLLLGEQAARDRLTLAVATLLLTTAQAVAVATLLGALGILRLPLALALEAGLVVALLRRAKARFGDLAGPAREILQRAWETLRQHPVLSLIVAHAVGSEALRGLLRTSLSWDSLMYHLLLTATWMRDGNLMPVFGNIPINYYGYVPANGALWFWWWMAPSHSELYVNVAALPHWLLFGLGVGAVARLLGARRSWPVAALLTLLTPTVVRFVATQYVDILLGALMVAAVLFGLRWLREPRWSDAVLAGAAMGLAAGTKVLGVAYGVFLALPLLLLARGGPWGRRLTQIAAALALAGLLGSYFYLRNLALGVEPLAVECEMTSSGPLNANRPSIPRKNSVLDLPEEMFAEGLLLDVFLGTTRPQFLELGVGPPAFVLFLGILAVPLGLPRERRREGWVIAVLTGLTLLFWLAVPFAKDRHVFANVRYLIPILGLGFAGGLAVLERRTAERWISWISIVMALQGMLQLHAEMPREVRLAMGLLDLALVALAVSERVRAVTARRWRELAAGLGAVCFLLVPLWARFRVADRGRSFSQELTAHMTTARFQAAGWGWLDKNGADGNVAAVVSPNSYFIYPAMGVRLERDVRYVNINRADLPLAAAYPACQPRVDPDLRAWLDNLAERRIRWVYLSRYPRFDFPLEDGWARRLPDLFAIRFEDETNVIYEFLPVATGRVP